MFEDWQDFYLLIGSAGAALIGLVFVVVTLTSRMQRSSALRGAALYMTPLVFSLGVVTVLSGVAMAPKLSAHTVGTLVAAVALWGLGHSVFVGYGIKAHKGPVEPHWQDFWAYGFCPGVVYLALLGVGVAFWRDPGTAAYAMAATLMVLLMLTIRNAWDLVTWIAPRDDGTPAPPES
jgi:hypothetical protein